MLELRARSAKKYYTARVGWTKNMIFLADPHKQKGRASLRSQICIKPRPGKQPIKSPKANALLCTRPPEYKRNAGLGLATRVRSVLSELIALRPALRKHCTPNRRPAGSFSISSGPLGWSIWIFTPDACMFACLVGWLPACLLPLLSTPLPTGVFADRSYSESFRQGKVTKV